MSKMEIYDGVLLAGISFYSWGEHRRDHGAIETFVDKQH